MCCLKVAPLYTHSLGWPINQCSNKATQDSCMSYSKNIIFLVDFSFVVRSTGMPRGHMHERLVRLTIL